MKTAFPIFLAVFVALGASFGGFVVGGISQLGTEKQTAVLNSSDTYPIQRTGDATLGLQVYRAQGCAACHTEQVQQGGVSCEVVLTSFGKKTNAVFNAIADVSPKAVSDELIKWLHFKLQPENHPENLAAGILVTPEKTLAEKMVDTVSGAGGKAEIHILSTGLDIERDWGSRRSVAEDFLWDYPVQLGSLRAGPDLANVGARLGNLNWQLQHLFAPQSVDKNSAMPPFKYLFAVRKKINGESSPDALQLPKGIVPDDSEVIPTDDVKNLAAYLVSLRVDVPLYDAPFTPTISAAAPAEKK